MPTKMMFVLKKQADAALLARHLDPVPSQSNTRIFGNGHKFPGNDYFEGSKTDAHLFKATKLEGAL